MGKFVRRPLPEFSWSDKRDRMMHECQQSYYLRYYASHNGWEAGAPREAHQAWALGKLIGVAAALGSAVHRRAVECAQAIIAREPLPQADVLFELARRELNELRASRDRAAFLERPKQHPMLHEVYYEGRLRPEQVERTRDKLRRCIQHLVGCPVWEDLRRCLSEGGEVLVVDSLSTFALDGVTIYAAPDLVYRRSAREPATIVDWKTGGSFDGIVEHVAVFGLLVRDGFGWPLVDDQFRCRVIGLSDGRDDQFSLDASDLADAEQRIRRSVARMRATLADPVQNSAHSWDAYPLNWRPWKCRHCPYLEMCLARINGEPGVDEDAA